MVDVVTSDGEATADLGGAFVEVAREDSAGETIAEFPKRW
jgi:hypothetical protein